MSRAFKREHGELRFNIPPNLEGKKICEVRIHPRNKARFFEIEYIYEQPEIEIELNADKYMSIDFGKVNNQNFMQIPHGLLRQKLKYQCELYGIKYFEQEESYTSKASFFDNDELPKYNANNPRSYEFSGKRISRGQYRTKSGYVLNADVNGALNILRKSNLIDLSVLQDRGCVNQPQRIRLF